MSEEGRIIADFGRRSEPRNCALNQVLVENHLLEAKIMINLHFLPGLSGTCRTCRTLLRRGPLCGCRPRRGSGGGALRTPDTFRKFAKKYLRKIAQNELFYHIFQNSLKTMRSIFVCLDENHTASEIFDKFSIIFAKFSKQSL